jgi:5-oxopent-3-ene-1,2,5-tricarboxylate decarboxylase / 2-hydroxyhepta-2,4-diene-1,7-dioate isomerase
VPNFPSYFLKPATPVAASGDVLERPAGTELLGFEGEIALIVGRRARCSPRSSASWAPAG